MERLKYAYIEVISTSVKTLEYDFTIGELTVTFLNGGQYVYSDVTPVEFFVLAQADSVGKQLNASIKPTKQYRKL